jgi:hypothetical protein
MFSLREYIGTTFQEEANHVFSPGLLPIDGQMQWDMAPGVKEIDVGTMVEKQPSRHDVHLLDCTVKRHHRPAITHLIGLRTTFEQKSQRGVVAA